MALIICPECKKQISEYADHCPHCGCPKSIILQSLTMSNYADKDYLYVRAVFETSLNNPAPVIYHFISDVPYIKVGDIALLENNSRVIVVETISVSSGKWAPFPPFKTKHIVKVLGSVYDAPAKRPVSRNNRYNSHSGYNNSNSVSSAYEDSSERNDTSDDNWTDADWRSYTGGESMDEFLDHEDY